MALKKFDQDLLTRIFRKIVKNYATQDELNAADKRIDDIISEGGEPNVINTVKENGVALEVTDKAVDVTVPTKTSELENDSGYITEADLPETVNPNILRGTNYAVLGIGDWSTGSWNNVGTASTGIEITDPPVDGITEGWTDMSGGIVQRNILTESGKTYTVSVYGRGSGTLTILTENYTALDESFDIGSDWTLCEISFTAEEDSTDLRFYTSSNSNEICGMKLEEGDTATPWCLSQFDVENKYVDSEIDSLNTSLTNIGDEITQLNSALTEIDGNLGSLRWAILSPTLVLGQNYLDVSVDGIKTSSFAIAMRNGDGTCYVSKVSIPSDGTLRLYFESEPSLASTFKFSLLYSV